MAEVLLIRDTRFEVHECLTCGCVIVASERVLNQMREVGGFYHCQNGHKQGWTLGGSEIERLRRERDRLKQDAARKEDEILAAVANQMKAERALTRHKKRAAAGLCPCCNRTFTNMTRHMQTEHPDYNVVPLKKA